MTLRAGPLNYLFVHSTEPGAYCLGVFDNHQQGTLLGGITFRNVYVQVFGNVLLYLVSCTHNTSWWVTEQSACRHNMRLQPALAQGFGRPLSPC